MTKKVLAAVKTAVETTELREFDYPSLAPDSGILRVEASGVGGSDPEVYRKPGHVPVIMGHENVGTLEAVGSIAERRWGVKAGDRVALHEYLPCWHCEWCMKGDFRLCMEVDFFNVKDRLNTLRFGMSTCEIAPHLWGGYAQYMHLPLNTVMHKIPHDLPATHATLAVPFGNGVQWACNDGGAGPGKTVLVFGPGQQGLGCVLAAKAAGALTVILAGMTRDRTRLDLSTRLGADHAIDVQEKDLKAEVMRLTNGRGVDVVVDTTGDPEGTVVAQAIELAAKGAYLSLNGLDQHVPIGEIKKRYLTVRAPRGRSYGAVELALRYIASGKYPLDEVCSHTFGLAQTHEAILATAGRGVEGAIHVCVDPWK
ncbi:zinc-dependent alcohol dehydrogenase [Pandoraea oxalativorans]|uniref:L-threonine 3-dehydrogenase n=1 Tax=Pandoraea oxalativorans TaxID=573737 RepID=A0A0E3YBV1_9BURK|nr:alcohol dehydrogenase catalytic domain-containing protein [Pandoraea oxalativorans]AKC69450.1 L-threonine 3-dehydrogenase [Pandoraea oxalativorans]